MTASRAEEILLEIRDSLELNGDEVFNLIDRLGLGYITSRTLGQWLKEQVGFNVGQLENDLIIARYDKDQDYKIKYEEFIEEVNAVPREENEEEEEIEEEQQ
jgi:Ca2+-binding EF-hand superfamily protein